MSYGVEGEIKKIISRLYSQDGEERQMFEKIFFALAEHQEKFLNELEKRIDDENKPHNLEKDFEIVVKLVKRGDLESKRNFFSIDANSNFIFSDGGELPFKNFSTVGNSFFILESYGNIKNFCEPRKFQGQVVTNDGTTKEFSYSLQRHERFIRREKILSEIAELYKIHRPIIFSPYARKAVDIKIFDCNISDFENLQDLNLQLEENKLQGKLLTNFELCWNLKIENSETRRGGELAEEEHYIGADGNLIRHEYFHTFDKNEKIFVLPDQHCNDLRINFDDERKIILGYNSVLRERACKIVSLNTIENVSEEVFTNDFPKPNNKLRLQTAGDVEKVLSCFNLSHMGKKFPTSFESFNAKNFSPIEIYRREDSYFVPSEKKLLGRVRNKPICLIKFGGDKTIFKTDYANYVIHYFEQNYPEFNWAGVET
ncbi:MAG: hypothetical protein IK062_03065 [Selenomonadaceae bacterium]|nr:hypothetical protein [Selenomonadaceae bacterium]